MMNGFQDDPFFWDEEQVAQVLGAANCAWSKDPSSVAERSREELIDGKTLLKFEHTIPRQEFMDCLGIKLTRHKSALTEEIIYLRSVSKGYRQWKKDFDRKQLGLQDDLETPAINEQQTSPQPTTPPQADQVQPSSSKVQNLEIDGPTLEDLDPYSPRLEIQSPKPSRLPSPSPSNHQNILLSPDGNNAQIVPGPATSPAPAVHEQAEHGPEDERAPKRRRIVPIALSTRPLTTHSAFIPTEADTLSFGKLLDQANASNGLAWESAAKDAYLGDGSLSKSAIKSPYETLSTRIVELDDSSFTVNLPNYLPCGRRLIVHRRTRNLLLKNSKSERLHRDGIMPMRSPSPSADEDDGEDINILDLPDTFDEQTKQEIAEEQAERERLLGMSTRSLSRDRVMAILDEAIAAMTSDWEETKLLKYKRKAYRQWHDAQSRMANRRQKILKARMDANFYNSRIKRLCAEILDQKWQKETDVRNQAKILEQNLEDKLYQTWFAAMLDSRNPPPKPNSVPKPKHPIMKQANDFSEEEILESSDEDDFIVHDDEPELYHGEPMDIVHNSVKSEPDSPCLSFEGESTYVDLTQTETPKKVKTQRKQIFIDLTSPMKSQEASDHSPAIRENHHVSPESPSPVTNSFLPPALDTTQGIEQVGNSKEDYWAKENDKWRLAICLIHKLSHARRTALLEFIRDQPLEDAWKESVQRQISHPLRTTEKRDVQMLELVAFDITKIFLSFVKCKYVAKDKKILQLSKTNIRKLEKARENEFPAFCKFINDTSHLFPQDSQIYRADLIEDDLLDDLDEDVLLDEEIAGPERRKAPPKEIIQNKEAVDLRERERQRQEEQEARRRVLRARVAWLLPKDKTRLIINESKGEDQALVCVNEDIGKQIMDHQVDGVRFLWNQLVLDPKTRQGCLLAHTMGLGKTMQVITLLTAIAEASQSQEEAMYSQIPRDLRKSQTLILCPSSLVDNWMDELLMWAPEGVLGQLRKIAATTPPSERLSTIEAWAFGGGILVMGYPMFKKVTTDFEEAKTLLIDKPNIVVADEAHKMKNKATEIHAACRNFRTKTRIALTGSPLANHVVEYYVMIDWVAPNFLGPEDEFKEIYAKPIQEGLTVESTRAEQRMAVKKLQALKETVAPKVNRMTVNECLKEILPQKHEFVISVPPTQLQSSLYSKYIESFMHEDVSGMLFTKVNSLGLICNHPRCFQARLKTVQEAVAKAENPYEVFPSFPKSVILPALKELKRRDITDPALSFKTKLLTIILDEARRVGDKVLIFTQSIPTLQYLVDLCELQKRRYCQLSGKTPISTRQDMVKNFNTGDKEVCLVSTNAGGEGLNLQGANRVIIFDFKWNPVSDQQAVGRAYRIGQTKQVYVYRFVVAGTFEEDLQNRHIFKTQLASRVVDKKNPISWGKRNGELFHSIEDRPPTDLKPFVGKDRILDKLIQCEGSIQSIVSTDTFEEEEPTVELTREERQEVDELIFRLSNPEEYLRQQHQRALENQQRAQALLQSAVPHFIPGLAHAPSMSAQRPGQSTVELSDMGHPSSTTVGSGIHYANPNHQSPRSTNAATEHHAKSPTQNHLPSVASTQPATRISGHAPMPVTGANTYFGALNSELPGTIAHIPTQTPPSPPAKAPVLHPQASPRSGGLGGFFKGGNLFSQPQNQARTNFKKHMADRVRALQQRQIPGILGDPEVIATKITELINDIRKREAYGFLPDNQHWRLLEEYLVDDRFVSSVAAAYLSPTFVAMATRENLEERINIIRGLSEEQFIALLSRGTKTRDPSNLQNIRRPRHPSNGSSRSPRASEDMRVMREAADNRRQRGFRLPPWANRALSEEQGRALPARETIQSIENRRSGSRDTHVVVEGKNS